MKARLEGLSFSQLDETSLRVATDKIMLQGAAISGCPLPNTEGFAAIIADELIAFITEHGYGEYSLAEVITALRLNATGTLRYPSGDYMEPISFSGNCFNVFYISKILYNYSLLRDSLDRKLQNFIDGH